MAANALHVNLRLKNFDAKRKDVIPSVKDALELFAPHLDGAELKVMLFIAMRTLHFQKTQERISTSQITHGVFTTDPATEKRVMVTQGVGKSTRQVLRAVKSLTEKGMLAIGHPGGCPKKEKAEEDYSVSLMESRKLMGLNFDWRPENTRSFQEDFNLYVVPGKQPTPITCPRKPKKSRKKTAVSEAPKPSITPENTASDGIGGSAILGAGEEVVGAPGGAATLVRTFKRRNKKKKIKEEVIPSVLLAVTGSKDEITKQEMDSGENEVGTKAVEAASTDLTSYSDLATEELIPGQESASLDPSTCSQDKRKLRFNKLKSVEMKDSSDKKTLRALTPAEKKETLLNISKNVEIKVAARLAERGAARSKGSSARVARGAWDSAVKEAFPALPPHVWTVAQEAQMKRLVEKAIPEEIDAADFFSTVIRNWITLLEECVGVKYAINCPRTPDLLFLVKHINKFLPAYKRCVDPLAPKGSGSLRLRTEVLTAQAGLSQAAAQLKSKDLRISELETRVAELQQALQVVRATASFDGAAATRGGVPPAGLAHGGLAAFLATRNAGGGKGEL